MELKELTEKTLEIFGQKDLENLRQHIMNAVLVNDFVLYQKFADLVEDLSIDWIQKIFQYYHADRKEKKQDFTPLTLARFVGVLAKDGTLVIDMCAGCGSLSIQKWNLNRETTFVLYELDENVIPFLLFNMVIRNIECEIHHADVLQETIFKSYKIVKGEKFGFLEKSK